MLMQSCRVLFKQLPKVHKAMAARVFSGQIGPAYHLRYGDPSALLTSIVADVQRRTLPAQYLHSQEVAMGHMNPEINLNLYAVSFFPAGAICLTLPYSSHILHCAAFASQLR